ncbi:tripartite motif-containing protein 60-like [Choloepus didactylus]|uniref:tripartite motif-containing protein 60-like n=1 Tax=Choloepus didactylus TaxID=27675 RepID=UPI00189DCE03|nr:tripartite motif-containing protein 60-like [Choloepus didactylus]
MAVAASLTELQTEASCPLCLDFLRDPVTIDCGHNFCCSCIHQCWEDLQDILPCPVCLHHCLDGDFKRNSQLSHLTEIVMQLSKRRSKRKQQEKKPLCEKHNRVVTLFCEQDLELLCAQCRISSDHQDHNVVPLEQAAAHHRKKLKSSIGSLKENIECAEKVHEIQLSKSCELKGKVEKWRMEKERFSHPLQYFGLQKLISKFKVDLTLDPETAHPNLIISEDRKGAIFGVMKPKCLPKSKAFSSYQAVRGCEGFDAGRHYWQVEVRGTGELALGVCKESFPMNACISPSPNNGCWKFHLWSRTHGTSDSVNHRQIGIFLDYELGEVSFYNLNNRSHLYTCKGMFTEKLVPYFSLGPATKCLTISIIIDE